MKVHVRYYLVMDGFGNKGSATCEESSDTIQINGLQNSGGDRQFFESDAYHLEGWCTANGFKYKCIEDVHDFDELWQTH